MFMNTLFKYVIVGGPQHGEIIKRARLKPAPAGPPSVVAQDGKRCVAAALRRRPRGRACLLLLHPDATGAQILTMLAA